MRKGLKNPSLVMKYKETQEYVLMEDWHKNLQLEEYEKMVTSYMRQQVRYLRQQYKDIIIEHKKQEKAERKSRKKNPSTRVYGERELRYHYYDKINIADFLLKKGVDSKVVNSIEKISDKLFCIDIRGFIRIEKLPYGYAYKGGFARYVLQKIIGLEDNIDYRDIDILRMEDMNPDNYLDDKVAKKYMPDDFENGHGVEVINSNEYFTTRDISQNEVYILNNRMYFLKRALIDIVSNTYYPSDKKINNGFLSEGKILAKAIRFLAENDIKGNGNAKVTGFLLNSMLSKDVGIGGKNMQNHFLSKSVSVDFLKLNLKEYIGGYKKISSFHLFLQLARSLEQSRDIAGKYVEFLFLFKQIPEKMGLLDAVLYFKEKKPNFKSEVVDNYLCSVQGDDCNSDAETSNDHPKKESMRKRQCSFDY